MRSRAPVRRVSFRAMVSPRRTICVVAALMALTSCADAPVAPSAADGALSASARIRGLPNPNDLLASRLPTVAGSCILMSRNKSGQYVSRNVKLPALAANARGSALARFAYRGWKANDSTPSRLAVCTIENSLAATMQAQRVFRSHDTKAAAISARATAIRSSADISMGTRDATDDLRPTLTRINAAAYGLVSIPAELARPAVPTVMTDGEITETADGIRTLSLDGAPCTQDPIIPEPGCEGDGGTGSGGGSGGGPVYCDVSAIVVAEGCTIEGETFSPEPPVAGPLPEEAVANIASSVPEDFGCEGRLDFPHYSSTEGFVGRVNVKGTTTCAVNAVLVARVTLYRQFCIAGLFCNWFPVDNGFDASPVRQKSCC